MTQAITIDTIRQLDQAQRAAIGNAPEYHTKALDGVDEDELFFSVLERPTTKDLPVRNGVLAAVLRELTAGVKRLHARINSVETRAGSTTGRDTSDLEQRIAALERRPVLRDAGVWRSGETYEAGAIVSHGGSAWINSESHIAVAKDIDHGRFRLLVMRGPRGEKGDRGETR